VGDETHRCPDCEAEFPTPDLLEHHLRTVHHKALPTAQSRCVDCDIPEGQREFVDG